MLRSDGEVRLYLKNGQTFIVTSTHRVYVLSEKDIERKSKSLNESTFLYCLVACCQRYGA